METKKCSYYSMLHLIFQRRSGKDRSDLQIPTLDDTLTAGNDESYRNKTESQTVDRLEETFRREGNAEILELSHSTLDNSVGGDEGNEGLQNPNSIVNDDVGISHGNKSRQVQTGR